jgi:hypothetical protein
MTILCDSSSLWYGSLPPECYHTSKTVGLPRFVKDHNRPVYPPDDIIHDREFTPGDYLGLDHLNRSGKARGVDTWRNEFELFAEELSRKGLEAENHEPTNDFYFTRDVARTLGIPFNSVSLKSPETCGGTNKRKGFTTGPKSPQEVQDIDSGD